MGHNQIDPTQFESYEEYKEYMDYLSSASPADEKSIWHRAIDPIAALTAGATDTVLSPFGMGDDPYTVDVRRENPIAAAVGQAIPYGVATGLAGGAAIKGLGGLGKLLGNLALRHSPKARMAVEGVKALLRQAPKGASEVGTARPALDALRSTPQTLGSRPPNLQDAGRLQDLIKLTPKGGKVGTTLPDEVVELGAMPARASRAVSPGASRVGVPDVMPESIPQEPSSLLKALDIRARTPIGKPANAPKRPLTPDEAEALAGGPLKSGESLGDYFRRLSDAPLKR